MITAIVQARMSSSRLPNKVMMKICNKPIIEHVFNQLSYSKYISKSVLATSRESNDDPLEIWAKNNNKNFFRGDLNNVLNRYYNAAVKFNASTIVRITADCPLIDPIIVDEIINKYLKDKLDYCSNTLVPTFPDGLDTEVFSIETLRTTYINAKLNSELEHVTPYIKKHPELFNIANFVSPINYSNLRWTLDNYEDYLLLENIYNSLYQENTYMSWEKVLSFVNKNKELNKINSHIKRDEGYIKSLNED